MFRIRGASSSASRVSPHLSLSSLRSATTASSAMSSLLSDLHSLDSKGVTKKKGSTSQQEEKVVVPTTKVPKGTITSCTTTPNAAMIPSTGNTKVTSVSGLMHDLRILDSKGLTKRASARPSPAASVSIEEEKAAGGGKVNIDVSTKAPGGGGVSSGVVVCPVCKKKFVSEDMLGSHIRVRHPTRYQEEVAASKKVAAPKGVNDGSGSASTVVIGRAVGEESSGMAILSPTEILQKQRAMGGAPTPQTVQPIAKILSLNELRKQVKKDSDEVETLRGKLILLAKERRRLEGTMMTNNVEETSASLVPQNGAKETLHMGYGPFAPLPKDAGPAIIPVQPSEAARWVSGVKKDAGRNSGRSGAMYPQHFPLRSKDSVAVGSTQHFTFSGTVVGEVVRGTVGAKSSSSSKVSEGESEDATTIDEFTSRRVIIFNLASNTFVNNSKSLATTQNKSYMQVRLLGPKKNDSSSSVCMLSRLDVRSGQKLLVTNAELGLHPSYHLEEKKWSDNVVLDVSSARGGAIHLIRDASPVSSESSSSVVSMSEDPEEDGESMEL